MSEFIVDLSDYRDTNSARVEPGEYLVVVDDAELTKSKAGNQMVVTYLRIIGTEFDGQTLVDRMTLTEKAMFRIVGFMQAIGMKTPRQRLKLSTARFVGKRLVVTVDDGDPFGGQVRSEVRGYMRPGNAMPDGGTSKDADEDDLFEDDDDTDLDDLETEDEAEVEAAPKPKKAKAKAKARPVEDDDDDDDEFGVELDGIDLDEIDV